MSKARVFMNRWRHEGGTDDAAATEDADSRSPTPCSSVPPPPPPPPSFTPITASIYVDGDERRSKDAKVMRCMCSLTDEQRQLGERGCLDDCINRQIFMECGSRCPCGDLCANKRFQRRENASVVAAPAGEKGFGLFAQTDIGRGDFVIEYVGEVLDADRFERRTKRYGRDRSHTHHYFMALKSGAVIDATEKGSVSRFINHSCEPNCETQKWTVNRQLRIGFFTIRDVVAGDELTFDYQFERYGREAQACLCGAPSCRGFIGGSDSRGGQRQDDADDDSDSAANDDDAEHDDDGGDAVVSEPRRRPKRKPKRQLFNDAALAKDLQSLLARNALKNKQQVIDFCRLMARGDDLETRLKLLDLLDATEEAVQRIFLHYQGCELIWSWLADEENLDLTAVRRLRLRLLDTLRRLPIPHITMLEQSRVLKKVQSLAKQRGGETDADVRAVVRQLVGRVCALAGDEAATPSTSSQASSDECPTDAADTSPQSPADDDAADLDARIVAAAQSLLDSWINLKQDFKIPKKSGGRTNTSFCRTYDVRRSSVLPVLRSPPRSSVRYNANRGSVKRARSRSPPLPEPLFRRRIGLPPSPSETRRKASRFDRKTPMSLLRTSTAKSCQPLDQSDLCVCRGAATLEERRRQFEEAINLACEEEEQRQQAAEFEQASLEAAEEVAAEASVSSSSVNLAPLLPRPLPGQPTVSCATNDPQPAVLVEDPATNRFWWQDRTSGTLVYPATEHQLVCAQMSDWSITPRFVFNAAKGLIHEVKELQASVSADVVSASISPLTPSSPRRPTTPNSAQREIDRLKIRIGELEQIVAAGKQESSSPIDMDVSDDLGSAEHDLAAAAAPKPVRAPSPIGLPADWTYARDTEDHVYYYHKQSRTTQWERPTDSPVASQAASTAESRPTSAAWVAEPTTTAAADTSSEVTRQLRERFKSEITKHVIKCLEAFRKPKKISSDDFKYLARKLSHTILEKEEKRGVKAADLQVSESVKKKAKDYIVKYMSKFGGDFRRSALRPSSPP